jgi:hypothetical protein
MKGGAVDNRMVDSTHGCLRFVFWGEGERGTRHDYPSKIDDGERESLMVGWRCENVVWGIDQIGLGQTVEEVPSSVLIFGLLENIAFFVVCRVG